jgi:MFS family permease
VPKFIWLRPVLSVLLPFAAGYCLSYLFRVINAVIAEPLVRELGVDAANLGFLSAVYFLTFAAAQIPIGAALDRFGPRRVQATLLIFAAGGAATFASAYSLTGLIVGRALIGLGVAGALVAGLKAIVDWFPKDRLPLITGVFVAIGASGAICATAPAEWILHRSGWRGLFLLLAAFAAMVSLGIFLITPEVQQRTTSSPARSQNLRAIYSDARFWRLAPLSALSIGSAWALQGLWAAPWLSDVARLERPAIVQHLLVMSCALCTVALAVGIIADQLCRRGTKLASILAAATALFILAELALALHAPMPTTAMWAVVSSMGAATVMSYSILGDMFPEATGRANAALNLLHIGAAFLIQWVVGVMVGLWPKDELGHYPAAAYTVAFLLMAVLQAASLWWFVRRPHN